MIAATIHSKCSRFGETLSDRHRQLLTTGVDNDLAIVDVNDSPAECCRVKGLTGFHARDFIVDLIRNPGLLEATA